MRLKVSRPRKPREIALLIGALAAGFGSILLLTLLPDATSTTSASYMLLYAATALGSGTILFPAPNIPAIAAHALVLDPIGVALVGGTGWAMGEVTGYLAGRSGRISVEDVDPAMAGRLRRWPAVLIFVLAVIPNPVFDLVGVLAGALRVRLATFIGATIIGRILLASAVVATTRGFADAF